MCGRLWAACSTAATCHLLCMPRQGSAAASAAVSRHPAPMLPSRSHAGLAMAARSLSLPTSLPADHSLSLPASQPAAEMDRDGSASAASDMDSSCSGASCSEASSRPGSASCSTCPPTSASTSLAQLSEPDVELGLASCGADPAEGPATPGAAERRGSSSSHGSLPTVEACVQAWAPACE